MTRTRSPTIYLVGKKWWWFHRHMAKGKSRPTTT